MLAQKFRGCLLGSLLGDCLGAPFEGQWEPMSYTVLNKYFEKLLDPETKVPYKPYTDDTAMTRCVAASLASRQMFNAADMAKRFTEEYYADRRRRYGGSVKSVFKKLKETSYGDPFLPAKEQFEGRGSYGNGGAMRVAPVALFCHNNVSSLIEVARQSALLTHANELGYNGAILQCLAVYEALRADPSEKLDKVGFVGRLQTHMKEVERKEDVMESSDVEANGPKTPTYHRSLEIITQFLTTEPLASRDEIIYMLGNDLTAHHSVPTAIYCFLVATDPLPDIKTENHLQRIIQYAISLGGDTDTIASMAGCIAGAYYGDELVSSDLLKHCEGSDQNIKLADDLFNVTEK